MGTVFAILAGIVAVAAILYVWRSVVSGSSRVDDDVRRIDMGTHAYAAQQAHEQLSQDGLATRLVTLEQGAFGIGMGDRWYLVYNAEDEDRVRAVVDTHLEGLDESFPEDPP